MVAKTTLLAVIFVLMSAYALGEPGDEADRKTIVNKTKEELEKAFQAYQSRIIEDEEKPENRQSGGCVRIHQRCSTYSPSPLPDTISRPTGKCCGGLTCNEGFCRLSCYFFC